MLTTPEPIKDHELAIDARQLSKSYRGSVAVEKLDLQVATGTTFGLLGPNGAGKSTAIRILMGLTDFDSGTASVLGRDVQQRPSELRERIGYVPELHTMYRWMVVADLLRFASSVYRDWDAATAENLLDQFELPLKRKVGQLSKGMMAKLGLLVALSHQPELLILDEPTSGLDPVIREDFLESILRSNTRTERTVLFSSHHVDDVERIADEVGIMVGGRMVLRGGVDQIRDQVKRIRMVLRDGTLPTGIPANTLRSHINRREWTLTVNNFQNSLLDLLTELNEIDHAEVIDLSLEDIFKDIVRGMAVKEVEVPA